MALSLPPDQQKRMGSGMVMRTFERVAYERLAQHAAPLQGNGRSRRDARAFCLAEMGAAVPACCRQPAFLRRIEDGHGCPVPLLKVLALVFACETVVHSHADVAA